MNKQLKLFLGYTFTLIIVLAFFTLASYANTFNNKYYEALVKFGSFFLCGVLLCKFFNKWQAVAGTLLFIGLLLYVLEPFDAYCINMNLPAYSFCCLGFIMGYFLTRLKPLITVAVLLITAGWAYINASIIYPNYMLKSIGVTNSTLTNGASITGIINAVALTKKDTDFTIPVGNGKVYLLDFFFTNCPPCKAKEPFVLQLEKEVNNPQFEILYIESGKLDSYQTYIANYNRLEGKVLYDKNNQLIDSLRVTGYPFEVIIDKKGIIRYVGEGFDMSFVGPTYVSTTKEKIIQLLNE